MPVAVQRVPYVEERAALRIEDRHVSLVGRPIADIAVGRGDHAAIEEIQSRRDLLAPGKPRDRRAPDHAAIGYRELADPAVGRRGVYELSVGIGDRCRVRDAIAAGEIIVAGRRELPERFPVAGVDRHGLSVARRDEESVVGRALDRRGAEIDGRGIHGPVQLDLLPHEGADIVRAYAHGSGRSIRAGDVPAESRPVPALLLRLREGGEPSNEEGEDKEEHPHV